MYWDRVRPDIIKIFVLAITIFTDGVSIFGNIYRNILDVYLTITILSEKYRYYIINIFLLILGFYSSDFKDVIKTLYSVRYIDEGIIITINSEEIRICLYIIYYTGDYFKINENGRFKGLKAYKFCRFYFIGRPEGNISTDILDINTIDYSRFHYTTAQQ